MSTTRQRIEELFEAALELPSAERASWIASACADDPAAAAVVLELLRAHEHDSGILDERLQRLPQAAQVEPEARQIGPYRVLRELGRGGMGVVYLAAREDESFKRRVAIKLLRGSPDADELFQRFRAERHILASLSHNNIAQLLDGGVSDGRLPYLVMEYVEGVPITEYCDRSRLGLSARLQLFSAVCAAVQHAHKNLVLHRDLKPGNILVNDAGEVKLLDFGIAKLLNPVLSGIELPITRTDHRVLTPQYASPEQVRGESLSTASDVYSLGVVLYELLSGCLPYTITTRSPAEFQELICEREPQRPSNAVRASPAAKQAAALRDTTVVRLTRDLRGDLDAIVMMALRKESSRRYGSAELLGDEIGRYLGGQPVVAQRDSARYRIGKLLRRHRGQVIAAALVTFSLIGGASAALWQASVARKERDKAEAALVEAQQALQQSREISAFMTGLFEASDPGDAQGGEATARELLRRGIRRADQLDGQPIAQAAMFDAIARVQGALGEYSGARALVERALAIRERQPGPPNPEVAQTLLTISDLMRMEGLYPEALERAHRALAIQERKYGSAHPEVARTQLQIALLDIYLSNKAEAITLAQRAVETQQSKLPRGDSVRFRGLLRLGDVYRRFGNYDEAESAFRRAVEEAKEAHGPEHPSVADAMLMLSYVLQERGARLGEAEQLTRQALQLRTRVLGAGNPVTVSTHLDVAFALSSQGRAEEALAEFREHVRLLERAIGPEHPTMAQAYADLGEALRQAGKYADAQSYFERALAIANRTYGPVHTVTAGIYLGYSRTLLDVRRIDQAEQAVRAALRIRERALGARSALVGFNKAILADVLIARRKFAEAESELLEGLALADETGVNPLHRDYRRLLQTIALVCDSLGRPADAARYRTRLGLLTP